MLKNFRTLSREEAIQKTLDDDKVHTALEDLVRAMSIYGRERATGIHLLDVIAYRLLAWSEYEEEVEGLDHKGESDE